MSTTGTPPSDITILCVEDEPVTREYLNRILALKYPEQRIESAGNGLGALEIFRESRVDIVVTDITMPAMDGIALARELRHRNPDVVIIAMTAHDEGDLQEDSKFLFDTFVAKPINRKRLYEAIDGCITLISENGQPE